MVNSQNSTINADATISNTTGSSNIPRGYNRVFIQYVLVTMVFTVVNWTIRTSDTLHVDVSTKEASNEKTQYNGLHQHEKLHMINFGLERNDDDDNDDENDDEQQTRQQQPNEDKNDDENDDEQQTRQQQPNEDEENDDQEETILSLQPPNTNWNNVQYYSGIIGQDRVRDKIIRKQCFDQSAIFFYTKDNPCIGPIISNTQCCYCYDEYPVFILEEQHWEHHVRTLGGKPTGTEKNYRYWFCAKERETVFDRNWKYIPTKNTKIKFITGKWGANDKFRDDILTHCNEILQIYENTTKNVNVYCYYSTPEFLRSDRRFRRHFHYQKNSSDESAKGGGYWVHKTSIMRYHMENSVDGTYLVWIDEDRIDFVRGWTFPRILQTMILRDSDFAVETLEADEAAYTKEDMLRAFNATHEDRYTNQVNANAWVVRNSYRMRKYIDAHIDCASDYHMISDEESILNRPNNDADGDHRHDQSIMSLMMKKFMKRQSNVGPPAQIYQPPWSSINTYTLPNDAQPECPFANFYREFFLKQGKVTFGT